MSSRARPCRDDRGSVSIWLLAGSALVLLLGVVVAVRGAATLARHRADTAADLAALAAAGRIGLGPDGCTRAATVARANGAELLACHLTLGPDGRSGTVDIRVRVAVPLPIAGAGTAIARARAGRLRAGSGPPTVAADVEAHTGVTSATPAQPTASYTPRHRAPFASP